MVEPNHDRERSPETKLQPKSPLTPADEDFLVSELSSFRCSEHQLTTDDAQCLDREFDELTESSVPPTCRLQARHVRFSLPRFTHSEELACISIQSAARRYLVLLQLGIDVLGEWTPVFAAEAAYLERKKCAEDAYDWIVDRAIANACATGHPVSS